MATTPLISIIMPAYNRQQTLPDTLRSVQKQTYTHWELIVVDDGSTDETANLIREYGAADPRIQYLSNGGNKGPSAARNQGIRNSRGEYIAFLDSDDEWLENHLEDSIRALMEEGAGVCFSLWYEKSSTGEMYPIMGTDGEKERLQEVMKILHLTAHKQRVVFPAPGFLEFTSIKTVHCCHINTMVCHREIIHKIGWFNEKLCASEDLNFIFRLLRDYPFCLILDYHFIYNQGEDNIHSFIDRRKIDAAMLPDNARLVNKLTFCGIYKCKALKLQKSLIRSSAQIARKDQCIHRVDTKIGNKYFTLGYLNHKLHKFKALYFLGKSMRYQYSKLRLKLTFNILFPLFCKQPEISANDLWLH